MPNPVNTRMDLLPATIGVGAGAAIDTSDAQYVRAHVYRTDDPAASTAVVRLQQSTDGTNWFTSATITNPTGMDLTTGDGGEIWDLPSCAYTRAYLVSRVAGTIAATIEIQR